MNPWSTVETFENLIANYFGSKYAVTVDCCTHAVELCLRLQQENIKSVTCPSQTYISIPFTFEKLNLQWNFVDIQWQSYYQIGNTNIYDAAVLWQENSYIPGSMMCLSFQFKKHLSLGKGGAILLDNADDYQTLIKMRYDGRNPNQLWAEQNISTMGYHYYMTPETAQTGIDKFYQLKDIPSKLWNQDNYPYLPNMDVFKKIQR